MMMTDLERVTLADGFRVLLLGAQTLPANGALQWRVTLFDGGRVVRTLTHTGHATALGSEHAAEFLALVTAVAAPPAVLAWYGNAARDVLTRTTPAYVLKELRVLDLLGTAAAFKPALRARSGIDAFARAYGLTSSDAGTMDTAVYELLLWAVVAEAGRRQISWPQLLQAARGRMLVTDFGRCDFDESHLQAVPAVPGVYVMYDRDDLLLYVGKSANLARRLNEYFRPTRALTAKTATLRDRIKRFEIHPAGSELESLLIENQWISRMEPGLNTQRHVAEGASRYAFPLLPVAIVCPSAQTGQVEVFVCGDGVLARQVAVNIRRPLLTLLKRAVETAVWRRDVPCARGPVTDWGAAGNEICCRYFARFQNRLTWLAIDLAAGTSAMVQSIVRAADDCLQNHEPCEFRLGE